MYNKVIVALLAASIGLPAVSAAQDDAPQLVPVEFYSCNYRDGKGPADLERAAADWNKFMDRNDRNSYAAWIMTPYYVGAESTYDFWWVGAWLDGATMGADIDWWLEEGTEHQAKFAEISHCAAHDNFVSMQIKNPPQDRIEDESVLTFTDCNLGEGASMDTVLGKMSEWSEHENAHGQENGRWLMFHVFGSADTDYDFKEVISYRNFSELGRSYDWWGTAFEDAARIFGSAVSCDNARVYRLSRLRDIAVPSE